MKKILVGYIDNHKGGGIDKYLSNFFESIDHKENEITFLTRKEQANEIKKSLKEKNAKLVKISRNKRPIKQFIEMIKLIKEEKYDVAYFNISETFNCIGILAARILKVDKIVVHSHSSGSDKENSIIRTINKTLNTLFKPIIIACSDMNLACSKKAAEWIFPQSIINSNDYEIIYNAIDEKKFKQNDEIRKQLRKQLNIENKFVLGHVGRFCYQKNHKFLLDVFKKVSEKRNDAILICIGDGNLFEEIKEYAEKINIEDKIIFTGNIDNVNEYIQTFDMFLLPSHFEGLPIVGVEAQLANIPTLLSDKISEEAILNNNTKLVELKKEKWFNEIINFKKKKTENYEIANNYKLEKNKEQFKKIYDKKKEYNENSFWLPLFKILFIAHLILNLTCMYNGSHILLIPMAITLIIIVLHNLKNLKKLFMQKEFIIILLFLISYVLTMVLSKNYDMINNIKIFIWMGLDIFVLLGLTNFKKKSQLEYEANVLMIVLVLLMTISNIYNLYLLINQVSSSVISLDNKNLILGISKWGRFFGDYYDPNYASITSGIAIYSGIYLIKRYEKKLVKLLLGFTISLQYVYIIFAQSRTFTVAFTISSIIYALFYLIKKYKFNKFKSIIKFITVILVVLFLPKLTLKIYNGVETGNKEKILMERKDVQSTDISNRRFDIWGSGLEIFKDNYIYGIGYGNIKPYAIENNPDLYIVNNDFAKFDAFHNMIIDVGVSQGIIGLSIVIAFIFYYLRKTIRLFIKFFNSNSSDFIIFVICGIIMIGISSMFLSEIFYVNNACTYIFWLLLGYYNYYINNKDKI